MAPRGFHIAEYAQEAGHQTCSWHGSDPYWESWGIWGAPGPLLPLPLHLAVRLDHTAKRCARCVTALKEGELFAVRY